MTAQKHRPWIFWLLHAFAMTSGTLAQGTSVIWVIQDTYEGQTFFNTFDFYTGADPTNGLVTFVDKQTAFNSGLAYVTPENKVIMQGDNTTWLPSGTNRNSVRISSQAVYNTGLFVLDLDMAPWGCGVWPAFWTLGGGTWPWNGEIDIIEGVHDNEHNQVTWHTAPGCNLTATTNFTGTIVQTNGVDNLQCNALINNNAGCGVTEWSRASYGPYFDSQGGGVFAMKWDDNGIAVWSFYRAAIPQDINEGLPDPSTWGEPDAELAPTSCNITQFFTNHSIIFDITFCGDWAGNSYATSGCPGTCQERLMDPANFVNASWIINSLKVYKSATLSSGSSSEAFSTYCFPVPMWIVIVTTTLGLLSFL
ncbi:glycoside hydrolase family 16 protein [Scleroderma yunnanense]